MTIEDELAKRKIILEKYYTSITQAIKKEPEGRIKVTKVKNGIYEFFNSDYGRGSKIFYIHKDDTKQISALLQKRYNHGVVKILEKQINAIKRFEKNYKDNELIEVYNSFNEDLRKYVKFLEYPDEEYARIWESKKYEGNPYPIASDTYVTKRGETVRSKSEVLIANALYDANIPYRYEHPLLTSDRQCFYPDFTILLTNSRKEVIWEHFGKMDDTEYREKAIMKIARYAREGCVIGRDFFATFEDSKNPLSTRTIEAYVEAIKKPSV